MKKVAIPLMLCLSSAACANMDLSKATSTSLCTALGTYSASVGSSDEDKQDYKTFVTMVTDELNKRKDISSDTCRVYFKTGAANLALTNLNEALEG